MEAKNSQAAGNDLHQRLPSTLGKSGAGLRNFILAALVLGSLHSIAQQNQLLQGPWADSVIVAIQGNREMDNRSKLNLLNDAFLVFQANHDTCNQVITRTLQGTYLDNIGMADSALAYLYWANDHYISTCDSLVLFSLYASYTNVFLSLDELGQVDSIVSLALDQWNPKWEDKVDRFAILTNSAISFAMQGEIDAANNIFRQVYHEALAAENSLFTQKALTNLGTIKGMTEDYDSAYYFLNAAALEAHESENVISLIPLLINLANVDMERNHYNHADMLLDSAYTLAEQRVDNDMMANVLDNKAYLYEIKEEFVEAYDFLRLYIEFREEFLNEERVRAVAEMMEKYQSERKARQIQQLELDKLDSQIENERITNARNRLMFLGGIVLLIAIGLWSRLYIVRKSRSEVQREKDIADGLLLNILPASVAEELKSKGHADAKYFDTATIMFSDFKDFTRAAGKMEAADLVNGINAYFKAFDEITTKYGVEKIKTIGDAYMAAGGFDNINPAAAVDVVCAAIEIQRFVFSQKTRIESSGLPTFEMRVGVHSGPVVAGIVGIKKFQYDLWGDTVNIASRMENNGVPEKVNISDATYQLIKSDPRFTFESRGMLDVKGKGAMQMYFVDMV